MSESTHSLDGSWPTERWRESLARPETWDEILQEVLEGRTLPQIAKDRGWPRTIFYEYVTLDGQRNAEYLRARAMAGDLMATEGRDLLDKAKPETLAVDKARSDYRKWLASKWDRQTYGDSVRVEQVAEVTLNLNFGKQAELPVVSDQ